MTDDAHYVHYENPFVTPAEAREPARRFRGRLSAGVTLWTAGDDDGRVGLTMSSVLIAEGAPAYVLGLMTDTTELYDVVVRTGAFVVHVLESGDAALADVFAGLRPSPGGRFADLTVEQTEWGPVLSERTTRAFCRFRGDEPVGYQRLVRGEIERFTMDDLDRPLVYYRGRYRSLKPRD